MEAYAIAITEENIRGIILSEAGTKYDLDVALRWLEESEVGWFVRDPSTVLDCSFYTPEIFETMYAFTDYDQHSLMRKVTQI